MSVVLVADDEPAVLDVLTGVVEDLGHQVLQAHDGRGALELIRRRRPDLVITDHMMPHVSGLDLCRALQEDQALRGIPVILLSGATAHGTPLASAFLPKPFELSEFEELVQRVLSQSGAAPSSRAPAPAPLQREEISSLLAWIAHELRTPLSAGRIQAHLLERSLGKPDVEARRKPLKGIKRQLSALELLAGVVADAAELLRGPLPLAREPAAIGALMGKVADAWRERQVEVEIVYTPPPEEVTLEVDPARVCRAVDVLIGNAAKHGARGRRVEVAVEPGHRHVAIRVSDKGRGIPQAKLPELFAGFRRDEGAGHGLELYVASEIARAHGGGITVRSTPGAGATFTLSLPRQ